MSASVVATEYGAELLKVVIDVIVDAIKGPEPPSFDVLRQRVHTALDARHDRWIAEARAAADQALIAAAAAAEDDGG